MFDEEIREANASPLNSERYVLKLIRLEDSVHPEYGAGIRWIFHVLQPDSMTVIRQSDGENYELWQTSGTKISVPKPGGKSSKQYRWSSAFLGRAVEPGETGPAIAQAIVGKYAEAMIGPNENGSMSILVIDPIGKNYPRVKAALLKKEAAAPNEEPEPPTELVGARKGDLEDLAF